MIIIVIGALTVGITLGVMGSGGSILTVPVLTYLLGHDSKVAIAESLAIVGCIAVISVLPYARLRQVDWPSVVYFGAPGMMGTYLGAWVAGFVSGTFQLVLFAVVMLGAAYMMFRGTRSTGAAAASSSQRQSLWKIASEGLVVGVITGLVGVGGGFLIVPALVLLGGLPMRVAVGTSLAVIALTSTSGLLKHLDVLQHRGASVDWWIIAAFIAVGVTGSLVGKHFSGRIHQDALRRGFAAFLLVMGTFVLGKEVAALRSLHARADHHASRVDVADSQSPVARREATTFSNCEGVGQ